MLEANPMRPPLETTLHSNAQTPINLTFDEKSDRLAGLGFVNGVLRALTLGAYGPWARTRVRQQLWSFTRLNGEPLEYTGTGRELFTGLVLATLLFVLPAFLGAVAVALLFAGSREALGVYQFALIAIGFLLAGNARYRAQRYRLSRTLWRGIRGGLSGSPERYGWTAFWTIALPLVAVSLLSAAASAAIGPAVGGAIIIFSLIAITWVLPWRSNRLQEIMTNETRFGDQPLSYSGGSGPLYKGYLITWLGSALVLAVVFGLGAQILLAEGLLVPTTPGQAKLPSISAIFQLLGLTVAGLIALGLLTASYRATQTRHFAQHTHFSNATFESSVSAKGVAWLVISNWVIWALAIFAASMIAGILIYGSGVIPEAAAQVATEDVATPDVLPEISPLVTVFTFLPFIIAVTLAATVAQYRSARYYTSRLKLNGTVDLAAVMQGASNTSKRGEGLAQVLDVDAF
jgi:uncharacterized membrane protein YjgN (DUF898 family)